MKAFHTHTDLNNVDCCIWWVLISIKYTSKPYMRSNNTIFKQMRRFVCVQNMQMHFKPNHLQVSTVRCIFGIYRKMNGTQLSLVMTKRLWHLCGHGQFHPQIFARQRFAEELKSTLADGNNVGFFLNILVHKYTITLSGVFTLQGVVKFIFWHLSYQQCYFFGWRS